MWMELAVSNLCKLSATVSIRSSTGSDINGTFQVLRTRKLDQVLRIAPRHADNAEQCIAMRCVSRIRLIQNPARIYKQGVNTYENPCHLFYFLATSTDRSNFLLSCKKDTISKNRNSQSSRKASTTHFVVVSNQLLYLLHPLRHYTNRHCCSGDSLRAECRDGGERDIASGCAVQRQDETDPFRRAMAIRTATPTLWDLCRAEETWTWVQTA